MLDLAMAEEGEGAPQGEQPSEPHKTIEVLPKDVIKSTDVINKVGDVSSATYREKQLEGLDPFVVATMGADRPLPQHMEALKSSTGSTNKTIGELIAETEQPAPQGPTKQLENQNLVPVPDAGTYRMNQILPREQPSRPDPVEGVPQRRKLGGKR